MVFQPTISKKELQFIINNFKSKKISLTFKKYQKIEKDILFYTKILNEYLPTFAERVYFIINNLYERPLCECCKKVSVKYKDKGIYHKFCSRSCSNKVCKGDNLQKSKSMKKAIDNKTEEEMSKWNKNRILGNKNRSEKSILKAQNKKQKTRDNWTDEYRQQISEKISLSVKERYKNYTQEEIDEIYSNHFWNPVEKYKNLPELAKKQGIIYCLKLWNKKELFYKVGITSLTLMKRFGSKNKIGKYNYEIVETKEMSNMNCSLLERKIRKSNKHLKYKPKNKFGGWTECYLTDIKL